MSFYIILWNYTNEGIKNVKESPKRADAFKSKLENAGGKLIDTYYTFGKYWILTNTIKGIVNSEECKLF